MKKTITLSVLLLCASIAIGGFIGTQKQGATDLLLNNVEALAQGEDSNGSWITTSDETEVETLSCGGTITTYICHVRCLPGGHRECKDEDIITITESHAGHFHAR